MLIGLTKAYNPPCAAPLAMARHEDTSESKGLDLSSSTTSDTVLTGRSIEQSSAQEVLASRGKELTNVALQFLSTASNETLAGCGVALCATTYLVLGRVGLVLIGAVGGVLLHATWDGTSSGAEGGAIRAESKRRNKEAGVEIAKRLLDWQESRTESTESEMEGDSLSPMSYKDFQPKTGAALTVLTDAVIRDYVKYFPPRL